jgi:succinyl-diaminopimelate desuccinylase
MKQLKPLKKSLPYQATCTVDKHQLLLYKDPNSDLVKNLMAVYKKHTMIKSETDYHWWWYICKSNANCVAFGPHFLDKPTFIHQKNEFIDISMIF